VFAHKSTKNKLQILAAAATQRIKIFTMIYQNYVDDNDDGGTKRQNVKDRQEKN